MSGSGIPTDSNASIVRFSASAAIFRERSIWSARLPTMPVIAGKPNFHRMKRTIPKISVIQKIRPKSGVIRDILVQYSEEADKDGEEACAFYEGTDNDGG